MRKEATSFTWINTLTLCDILASARNLQLPFISYGKLGFNIRVFSLRYISKEGIYH